MVHFEFHNYAQEAMAARLAAKGDNVSHNVTVISTLRDRTPQPQPKELDECQAIWGKPSNFSWGTNKKDFDQGVTPSTTWDFNLDPNGPTPPEPPPDEPDLETLTEYWEETERKETLVRIDGPDGAYVDFMRIDEVTFQLPDLPDGRKHFVVQRFKAP